MYSQVAVLYAGVLLSKEELERAAELTARAGAWLIMDNTYEHFVYDGLRHHCISAPHIIHLFSFSKVGSILSQSPTSYAHLQDGTPTGILCQSCCCPALLAECCSSGAPLCHIS